MASKRLMRCITSPHTPPAISPSPSLFDDAADPLPFSPDTAASAAQRHYHYYKHLRRVLPYVAITKTAAFFLPLFIDYMEKALMQQRIEQSETLFCRRRPLMPPRSAADPSPENAAAGAAPAICSFDARVRYLSLRFVCVHICCAIDIRLMSAALALVF